MALWKNGSVPQTQKKLKTYLNEICSKTLLSRESAKATDISGALSIISQLARAQADEGKYLVILSDMFEHRIDEISVSKIDLSGFNVLVVCHSNFLGQKRALRGDGVLILKINGPQSLKN